MAEPNGEDSPLYVPFRNYFGAVCENDSLKEGLNIRSLRSGHIRFGLSQEQMRAILAVVQEFEIVQFQSERAGLSVGEKRSLVLDWENILGLAVIIGLGFNRLAVGRGRDRLTSTGTLYPKTIPGVRSVRTALQDFPDLLDEYPFLSGVISDPTEPANPDKEIRLSAGLFDPATYMKSLTPATEKGSDSVSALEKAAHYHIKPRVIIP